jgi:hypothetical protein
MMRTRHRRARALAFVVLATTAACTGEDAEVVAGPAPTLERVPIERIFEIGAAEGEPWQVFGGIWDVEASPAGEIAVLDLEAPAVHVYDSTGAHLGSVMETGLDEGALDRPSGIAWKAAGELLVWDPGSSWISTFAVRPSGLEFVGRQRAFAFGETGFCSYGGRTYLSYWQDGLVVHEVGEQGPIHSFGPEPEIPGVETLGPELQEIAIEELTPSGLLCSRHGVFEASFFGSQIRLDDFDGEVEWSRDLDDVRPMVAYTLDGMGLGRGFDEDQGSPLLRSIVPWGPDIALVQYELRRQEFPEAGEIEVIESRLIRLEDGVELARSRDWPLILAALGTRIYVARDIGYSEVVALEVMGVTD